MKAKKILALVLAIASMMTVMVMPAFAEEAYYVTTVSEVLYTLTPNADNWINGQNYRFETSTPESSYARIIKDSNGNNRLELKMTMNDLFWIPSLNIKDETTTFAVENMEYEKTSAETVSTVMSLLMVTGITSKESGDMMICTGVYRDNNKVPMWYARAYGWATGNGVSKIDSYNDWRADGDTPPAPNANDPENTNGYFNAGEKMSAKVAFVNEEGKVAPRVHMYEGSATAELAEGKQDIYFTWKPMRPMYGAFGIAHESSKTRTITIDTISATNTVETDSWTETFENFDMSWVGQGKAVTLYQGYQTTAKNADGKINIRFVATVGASEAQLAGYQNVGFEILPVSVKGKVDDYTGYATKSGICDYPKINRHENEYSNIVELTDKNKDKAMTTLFTSVLEGTTERDVASFLGANTDGYIYVLTLTDVPTDNNLHFAVRTYYTDAAGNRVYGEIAYIKVDMSTVG